MRTNQLKWAAVFACAIISSLACFACECSAPAPACSYISAASIVFVGTPVFSNDNGSGTFIQQTLYKFAVDEIFKGLPEGTKEVWVDPGSYTSCYAVYKIGTKLLVFASKGKFAPVDTAAMTIAKHSGKKKPLPPGFDPKMPVYFAPECSGTRDAVRAAEDIAWLRLWKKGDTRTRIQGIVLDNLYSRLPGVSVTARRGPKSRTVTTNANGEFSFEPVEPGRYDVSAMLAPYDLSWGPQVEVPEHACSHLRMFIPGTGVLSGNVVGRNGKPVSGLQVDILRLRGSKVISPVIRTRSGNDILPVWFSLC